MKITHIVEASATGTLSMLALLANAQAEQKNIVEVIYSVRPETPKNITSFFSSEITLTNIQMCSGKEKASSILKIRSHLKKTAPDNIILHSSFAGFLGRIASIGTLHKSNFYYIPHCISFMRKDISQLKKLTFILFEWFAALKKSAYVACSESERKEISAYIPFRKCHLVENAVNINITEPRPKTSTTKTIITVGQIRPQKGPKEFAKIAKHTLSIDPNLRFIWVGDGDTDSRAELDSSGVTVLGWIPKDEVITLLDTADIYLSTAKWEGMPVSLIEAIYSGLPLVASECAGNVDIIEHGLTGWIFGDNETAANKIIELANNPHTAETVAKRALEVAKTRFTPQRYISDMSKLMSI